MTRPMRRPSRIAVLYRWHTAAIRGEAPSQHDGYPECGWYRTKVVKGGPWVPARIWIERHICPTTGDLTGDEVFRCEVGGRHRDADDAFTWLMPISKAEYDALVRRISTTPAMAATNATIDLTREAPRP